MDEVIKHGQKHKDAVVELKQLAESQKGNHFHHKGRKDFSAQ